MKFIICGVPRSGTTIITRFIGGLPGIRVVHEPLQSAVKFTSPRGAVCTIDYIRQMIGGCARTEQYVGVKEPFLHYPGYGQFANGETLSMLRSFGAQFVFIDRDPVHVFNSQKHWGEEVYQNVRAFVQNWNAFQTLKMDSPSVNYERFCDDPVGEWNRYASNFFGFELPKAHEVVLSPCPKSQFMGCHRAEKTGFVDREEKPMIVTQEEMRIINDDCIRYRK